MGNNISKPYDFRIFRNFNCQILMIYSVKSENGFSNNFKLSFRCQLK
jgi:hypothetical protein